MLKEALEYEKAGYSIIPVKPDKRPLIPWEKYQKEKASPEQIQEWWKKWPSANIGIITGQLSNLLVIDTDTPEATLRVQEMLPEALEVPCQTTPSGGMHFIFEHIPGLPNRARIQEGIDLRTEGGYFVASPSVNGNGKSWQWIVSPLDVTPPPAPVTIGGLLKNLHLIYKESQKITSQQVTQVTTSHKLFLKGSRDDDLFHVANALIKGGSNINVARQVLEILANNCQPPFPKNEIDIKIMSAIKRAERKEKNITEDLRVWVESQEGHWKVTEYHRESQVVTKEDKHATIMAIKRLCEQGVIEKYGKERGIYRKVENQSREIDWYNANDKALDLKWPFKIEELVEIMPKNIIIVAGEKNAGKTAFLLNFCQMNMGKEIHYFSSEMADSELKKRLVKFSDMPLKKWLEIDFRDRMSDFHDVIYPDAINIIDFLEIYEEFYKVGLFIRNIFDKLRNGICIIAIQKNPGVDWGLGGARSLEKARLYLSISRGRIKIVSGKNRKNDDVNADMLEMDFKLVQGAKFIQKSENWYREKTL